VAGTQHLEAVAGGRWLGDSVCEVVITSPDANWLRTFTRALLLDRVVARCHDFQVVRTTFLDGDELQEDQEARVHLHTRELLVEHIVRATRDAHYCGNPCVLVLPVSGGSADYLVWVREQTREPIFRHVPPAIADDNENLVELWSVPSPPVRSCAQV
jgi:periplasmic divalent cation tolerance protein